MLLFLFCSDYKACVFMCRPKSLKISMAKVVIAIYVLVQYNDNRKANMLKSEKERYLLCQEL